MVNSDIDEAKTKFAANSPNSLREVVIGPKIGIQLRVRSEAVVIIDVNI